MECPNTTSNFSLILNYIQHHQNIMMVFKKLEERNFLWILVGSGGGFTPCINHWTKVYLSYTVSTTTYWRFGSSMFRNTWGGIKKRLPRKLDLRSTVRLLRVRRDISPGAPLLESGGRLSVHQPVTPSTRRSGSIRKSTDVVIVLELTFEYPLGLGLGRLIR